VIAIHDGVYAAGRYQVLALNRGKKHGSSRATSSQSSSAARKCGTGSAIRRGATWRRTTESPLPSGNASVMVFGLRSQATVVVESTSQISVATRQTPELLATATWGLDYVLADRGSERL
jgi:hypothetical protein